MSCTQTPLDISITIRHRDHLINFRSNQLTIQHMGSLAVQALVVVVQAQSCKAFDQVTAVIQCGVEGVRDVGEKLHDKQLQPPTQG